MPFYAVAKGKNTGVYLTWAECQEQINGFKGPVFKKFSTEEEAKTFVSERSSNLIDKRNVSSKTSSAPAKDSIEPITSSDDKSEKNSTSTDPSENSLKRSHSEEGNDSSSPKKTKLLTEDVDKSKFTVNEDGFLVLYTDGSCGFNGKHGAKAGVGVYFGPGHPMNVSEPVKGRATNNTAEIQAATYAFELAKSAGFDKVQINTDSQFMINCATSWLPNWKKRGWKKADGGEVINKEDLIDMDKASEGLLVKWNHVKGHEGNEGNEAADRLAREGAKRYVKQD